MKNKKTIIILSGLLVLLLGGASVLYNKLSDKVESPQLADPKPQTTQTASDSSSDNSSEQSAEKIVAPDFTVYDIDGNPVPLTAKEFKMLDFFTLNENCLFGKQKIIDEVWGVDEYIDENTVAVTVARIREKLEKEGVNHVVTVWGLGYKWQY